jgi:hypothetical protein
MKTVLIFLAILVAFVGAQSGPTKLSPGFTVRASTARQSWSYFYVELSEATINYVSIASVASVGDPFYYFAYSSLPTFSNYFWKKENTNNFTKIIPNPNVDLDTGVVNNTRLYIGVYGYTAAKYSLLATTQGPYTLRDRRARNDTGVVNSYVFYKLSIDRRVRQFQAVNQGNPVLAGSNMLYLTNSTSYYPVYRRNMWEATSTRYYDCLTLENPAPGNYRLAVDVIEPKYTLQFVQNGPNTCSIQV